MDQEINIGCKPEESYLGTIFTARSARYKECEKLANERMPELSHYVLNALKHKSLYENNIFFDVYGKNAETVQELENLYFNKLKINYKLPSLAIDLCIKGDLFLELIPDLHGGIAGIQQLSTNTMFRIETIRGKLLEFQQSTDGPDYEALQEVSIQDVTQEDLKNTTAIRFKPKNIIHARISDDRRSHYPYGTSMFYFDKFPEPEKFLKPVNYLVLEIGRRHLEMKNSCDKRFVLEW